ncbi:MAG: hypothetical protein WA294_04580 [Acidobacteriaceae bacterium]
MKDDHTKASNAGHDKLLALLAGQKTPNADELKQLILALDNHRVLATVHHMGPSNHHKFCAGTALAGQIAH